MHSVTGWDPCSRSHPHWHWQLLWGPFPSQRLCAACLVLLPQLPRSPPLDTEKRGFVASGAGASCEEWSCPLWPTAKHWRCCKWRGTKDLGCYWSHTLKSGRCELWVLKAACLHQPLRHRCSWWPPSEHIRLPCSSTGQQRRRRWLCSQASPATLLPSYSYCTELIWLPLWGFLAGAQQQPFCATAHIVLQDNVLAHRAINSSGGNLPSSSVKQAREAGQLSVCQLLPIA